MINHKMISSLLLASAMILPGIPASAAETAEQTPVPDRFILVELPPVEAGEGSTSVIEADEPLITALLASDPDYSQYASLTLEEITSSETGSDGMTLFHLPVTEDSTATLFQNAGTEILTTDLTGIDAGALSTEEAPEVSYFSGTNHWLAVRFTAKDTETAEVPAETEIVEETAEETAAESLEGKTDPETDASEARAETAKAQSTTKAAKTTKAATRAAETKASTAPTKATTAPTKATSAPTTTAPTKGTTKAAETTAPTTAHVHSWVPVTKTVHHDATTKKVWVVDQAAYDETVVVTPAWDEQVLAQAAYDETVVVTPAYDEPVYDWQQVCNVCGYVFPIGTSIDDIAYHIFTDPGCGGGYHAVQVQVGSTHHDAVTQVVHHDAVYQTVHHDAVTTNVHHDEVGHYETVTDKAAYDETVTTGYQCSVCGATK